MPATPRPALARVHRVVIGAAVVLAVIFSGYCFKRGEPFLALVSAALAIALAMYLRWFSGKALKQLP
jgi:hypothetical protein